MKKRLIISIIILLLIGGAGGIWAYYHRSAAPEKAQQTPKEQQPETSPKPSAPSYVDQTLDKMSMRDKVASLFVFHTPGTDPTALASYYTTHKPSGLIFMGDNIPYKFAELRAETGALVTDKQLPPLIAVDEEGDTVKRLAADTYPGALTLRNQPPAVAKTAFEKRSDLLKGLGLNLNFGIIADVTADPNSFIYSRVLGTTPQAAADRVTQAVLGSKDKTLSTIKHFPGHGETTADSHTSIPTAATAYNDWLNRVAVPFKAGIDAGADLVMFGHLRYSAVDQSPATLSKKWHDTIRDELGFKGLIITDDMIMLQNSGEAAYANPVSNAVSAIQAGNNLLLYVLNHDSASSHIDPNTLINGVVQAVNDGQIDQKTINEHVRKVLNTRHELGKKFYMRR